jgi:uncharacterized membrane protein YcaP (DUF421 family)
MPLLLNIDLLGLDAKDLEWYQMFTRTLIVFFSALIFIRISGMRTFGTSSAFDVVISISLGAILGKCIMGHYPFLPGLATAGFFVCLHWLVARISSRNPFIRKLTEGDAVLIFAGGEHKLKAQKKYNITSAEIYAALHEQNLDSFDQVKMIWLEPDGMLSIVKKT